VSLNIFSQDSFNFLISSSPSGSGRLQKLSVFLPFELITTGVFITDVMAVLNSAKGPEADFPGSCARAQKLTKDKAMASGTCNASSGWEEWINKAFKTLGSGRFSGLEIISGFHYKIWNPIIQGAIIAKCFCPLKMRLLINVIYTRWSQN
jgi:hypothetical protein